MKINDSIDKTHIATKGDQNNGGHCQFQDTHKNQITHAIEIHTKMRRVWRNAEKTRKLSVKMRTVDNSRIHKQRSSKELNNLTIIQDVEKRSMRETPTAKKSNLQKETWNNQTRQTSRMQNIRKPITIKANNGSREEQHLGTEAEAGQEQHILQCPWR